MSNTDSIKGLLSREETHNIGGYDFVFSLPSAEDAMKIDRKQIALTKIMPSRPNEKMSDKAIEGVREFQILCIKSVIHCTEEEARQILISTGQTFYQKVSAFLGIEGQESVGADPT